MLIVAQKNSILSTIWVRNGNYANVQKIVERRNLRIELQEEKFILVHVEDSKNFLSVLVLFPQKLFASDYLRLFCDLIKKKTRRIFRCECGAGGIMQSSSDRETFLLSSRPVFEALDIKSKMRRGGCEEKKDADWNDKKLTLLLPSSEEEARDGKDENFSP